MTRINWLIFTDMDGTLLDHHTYSFDAAADLLSKLKDLNIPVIPNTSKTAAEVITLRDTLGLDGPFIIENGAAVYIPQGTFKSKPAETIWQNGAWVKQFTSTSDKWKSVLSELSEEFDGEFTSFSSMSVEQICFHTGLSKSDAELAAKRQYTEPVLWHGTDESKERFVCALTSRGASVTQGGRFIHVSGQCSKGDALQWLENEYARQFPQRRFSSVALGDGNNDVSMLDAAEYAVLIRSPVHPFPELTRTERCIRSAKCGPEGWTASLQSLLSSELSEATW